MADVANSIALILKYAPDVFDDVYKKEATSSILQKNSADIQFTGAKTVRVAKRQFGGLNPYHRNNIGDPRVNGTTPYGYQASEVGLTWEDHTLEMDRAAYYPIEMFDDEESGGKIVGTSITYIDQYILVPEVDAYCWSKIYSLAGKQLTKTGVQALSAGAPFYGFDPLAHPLASLNMVFKYLADHEVPENDQVIIGSTAFQLALQETTEFNTTRFVDFGKEGKKDLAFNVIRYQGREIVIVPPQRFKTKYDFTGHGFVEDQNALDIDLIGMPKSAAVHIVKYQKTRILDGNAAVAMTHLDGYVILTRIYHDVIVFDNKRVAIVAAAGFSTSTVSDSYNFELDGKGRIKRIIFEKGDIWTTYALNLTKDVSGTATALAVGDEVLPDEIWNSTEGTVKVGSVVKNGDTLYVIRVGSNGKFKVVKAISVTTADITAGSLVGTI